MRSHLLRKNRYLFAGLIAFFVTLPALGQTPVPEWILVENSPEYSGYRFEDMEFINPDRGWIVNLSGEIWGTADAGESWQLEYVQSSIRFRSVGFVPNNGSPSVTGWAGTLSPGPNGLYLLWEKKNNGTWNPVGNRITGDIPSGICGMWVVNSQVAYGVGYYYSNPVVIKTTNGGLTWVGKSISNVAGSLVDVFFKDENEGFVVGGSVPELEGDTVILHTTDGGQTWTKVHQEPKHDQFEGEWGWKISFPTDDVGYVSVEYPSSPGAGTPAKVLKTTDGGMSWHALTIPGSAAAMGLQGIGFVTKDIGWASGRGITSVTVDGGASWQQLISSEDYPETGQLDGRINRIQVVNDTLAYAVGHRLYRLDGMNFTTTAIDTRAEIPAKFTIDSVYPNPFSQSVTIEYTLHESSTVNFRIHDVLGRYVRRFPSTHYGPGTHSFEWDGRDNSGQRLPSGNYLIMADMGDAAEIKMVVKIQ